MFRTLLTFSIVFAISCANAQVSVNSTAPSSAAVLHLESLNTPSMEYGGMLLPVVTEAQQGLIPVSTSDTRDDGLTVFVSDPMTGKRCWDIYDGVNYIWRSINCFSSCASVPIYSEDFSAYPANTGITGASATNGAYPSGVSDWSISSYTAIRDGTLAYPGSLIDIDDYILVTAGRLEFQDTNGPALFETRAIDISSYGSVNFSFDISESGTQEYASTSHTDDFNCGTESFGNDYVDVEYSTDNGATFTEMPNYLGNGNGDHTLIDDLSGMVTVTLNAISGTTLILRVRLQNWASNEQYVLDNILVTCN